MYFIPLIIGGSCGLADECGMQGIGAMPPAGRDAGDWVSAAGDCACPLAFVRPASGSTGRHGLRC